jgi:hypothetical protein
MIRLPQADQNGEKRGGKGTKKEKHMTPRLSYCFEPQSCAFNLEEEKVTKQITFTRKRRFI